MFMMDTTQFGMKLIDLRKRHASLRMIYLSIRIVRKCDAEKCMHTAYQCACSGLGEIIGIVHVAQEAFSFFYELVDCYKGKSIRKLEENPFILETGTGRPVGK